MNIFLGNISLEKVYFLNEKIDFRNGIDGLRLIISTYIDLSEVKDGIFILRNKRNYQIKILIVSSDQMTLIIRRKKEGKFNFPKCEIDQLKVLSDDEIRNLLL
jgi:hypothetical protein